MAYALRPMKAKVDEVRLVQVEREPVPCKPLSQHVHDPLGVVETFTLSSAYRTRMPFPLRSTRTSRSNHSSSAWCR